MKKIILFSAIALLVLATTSCKKEGQTESSKFGITNISHTDCKQNTKSTQDDEVKEYMIFKTIDEKYLDVQHINAEFNCCPGELVVNSTISNDTVTINEDETEHSCNCICKYDLKYKLGSLEYGKYHVIFKKLNWTVSEFDLDFNSNTNFTIRGGNCKYKEIKGRGIILSITEAPLNENKCIDNPKMIKFKFIPNDANVKYLFTYIKDTVFLKCGDGKHLGENWIHRNEIEVGKEFECNRLELLEGTCSPITFKYPEFDDNCCNY